MQAANVNVGLTLEHASFVSGAEQARRAMVGSLEAIQKESARAATALGSVTNSTKNFGQANDNVKRFGSIAQQAGFQVGDFAVQIAGGTSSLTAFIQQGSQIAGAFGPVGAVIGAAGAVLGVFAKTLLDSGDNAEDAQVALDKLTKSTDEYREALLRVQPLEIARLQNIIDYKSAAEAAAAVRFAPEAVMGRQAAGNAAQNPFAPSVGMLPGGLNPFTGQPIQQEIAEARGAINRYEGMTQEFLDAQYRARQRIERAQQEIRDANKPGIIAKAEFKPGEGARDYVEAERAAAEAATAATKAATTANNTRIADAKRTADALKRLEEDRADDFAESLKRDMDELDKYLADKQKAFADAYQNIADENDKALEEEQRARDRAAEQQAEIYAQPFKDLATNLSNTISEGIQDALSGDFDFKTFADSFGDIFANTLAASITSALTPALTKAADSFGAVLTKALGGGTAAGGAPFGAGLTVGGAALGGAAFGGIGGGLYGSFAPGMKPGNFAGIGGAIGGAGGAGLGAFLMPANPLLGAGIGGSIGGLLGSLTGGLFGGQNNLGNDRSAQAYRSGRGLIYSDASFSAENRQITEGILTQVEALEKALETAGGAIASFGLRIEAGNKTGITVNGKSYPNAQAALAASLERLIGGTTGLSASQQTVLGTTKARDAAGIAADLDFAAQFDAMTFTGTALEAQLKTLDSQMQQFARRAGELGLSVDAVAAAHQREAQALVDAQTAQQNQIRGEIQALAPSGNPLELQLAQLNDHVQGLARAAQAAGLPLEELASAHQRAAATLVAAHEQMQASVLKEIEALAPSGDTLSIALSQLNDRVQELAKAAVTAGLPLDQLAAAHQRAAAQLVAAHAQLQANLRMQVAAIGPATNTLQGALDQLNAQVQALAADLTAAGLPLDELAAQHQRAAAQIVADYRAAEAATNEAARQQALAAAAARAQARENARQADLALKAQRASVIQQITQLYGDTSLEGRFKDLNFQIKQLAQAAAEAGIPIKAVTDAQQAASKELVRIYTQEVRGVYEQIAAFRGDNSLANQFSVLETQMLELKNTAVDLGIPLSLVSEAWSRAAEELARVFSQNVRGFYDKLAAISGDTGMAQQLHVLATQMNEVYREAQQLGIPMEEVAAAHRKAADAIWEEFEARRQTLRRQIDDLGESGRPLDRALEQLKRQAKEIAEALVAAEAPGDLFDKLEQAHHQAAERIIEDWEQSLRELRQQHRDLTQNIVEAQRGAAGAIDQFLDPITEALSSRGIGQGVYAGSALTQSGLREFRSVLEQARTGDAGALSSLVGIGQGAISQARQTYGSTAAFASIFEEIQRGLQEQQGVLEEKRDQLLRDIGDVGRETVDEIIRLRVQAIGDLREDLAKLSRDLIVAVEGRS